MVGTIGKTNNKGKTMNGLDLKSLVITVHKYAYALRHTELCPEEREIFFHDALVDVHGIKRDAANLAIDTWLDLPLTDNESIESVHEIPHTFFRSIVKKSCNSKSNVQ
jgi:hypothetical protein